MKILQICSAESIGGGERHVMDLIRALTQRGHELYGAVRPASPLPSELADVPVQWHEVKLRNAIDWFSVRRLRQIITENQIDIVHAHLARDYPLAGLATKSLPVRFFLTRHHFHPIKANLIYESTLNHVTKLIAVSATVQQELSKAFPTLADRVCVIPNWLDERTLHPLSRKEARAYFGIKRFWAIALIGQITPLKRQDLFLDAIKLLTANNAYERAEFFIIGAAHPADQAYETRLKARAQELGLADRIHFTGRVEDLPRYLSAFDLIVAPSENEGFSLATIEAMAAGCAVIAANVGGLAEIIEHQKTGLLFEPGRAELLAQDLRYLLMDSLTRKRIGQSAQAMARELYDREKIVAQIELLYQGEEKDRKNLKKHLDRIHL
jgi:L-malate glycosyltransferase